ncbi:MAG: undecaprenyldiphospho-muramoylpentapeptide beta-N-acetylglucosaminyltransferase [Gammaproteobacteria bacterium]|nr:undecaprenyldiphospho-muramoylpentapeptide beta-N-acetylglucosaminyltransferase [Gammaproteobacteria bacterium]
MSTVLIMAGGTGGHVFPALAVARELRRRGAAVVWLGRRGGLEARVARDADIALETVNVSGLRGRGLGGALLALLKLPVAVVKALWVARRRRPDVFLGMGGFVSVPGAAAAFLLRRPLVVHEANAVAGLANRALARIAARALSAYPGALPGAAAVGNPVRGDIAKIPAPEQRLAGRRRALRVLVLGGSQGAAVFNRVMPAALAQLREMEQGDGAAASVTVRHQCGAGNAETVTAAYRKAGGAGVQVVDFIEDMAAAYAWCDIAVCRAGAMTLSELAAAGVGAVLVPFPFAAGRHQDANAAVTARAGAAIRLPQEQLKPPRMASLLRGFLGAAGREKILRMAVCARALAATDAAARVAGVCLGLAGNRRHHGGAAHA